MIGIASCGPYKEVLTDSARVRVVHIYMGLGNMSTIDEQLPFFLARGDIYD